MKRFLLFAGIDFPALPTGGGWDDFASSHDSIDEARNAVGRLDGEPDWYHIVDSTTGEMVVVGTFVLGLNHRRTQSDRAKNNAR